MPGGVDPIYQQQQQQYFYNKGLERAKKAQRERKVSRLKPGFVLAVAFVLVLAVLFVLLGGLGIFDHQHVHQNNNYLPQYYPSTTQLMSRVWTSGAGSQACYRHDSQPLPLLKIFDNPFPLFLSAILRSVISFSSRFL